MNLSELVDQADQAYLGPGVFHGDFRQLEVRNTRAARPAGLDSDLHGGGQSDGGRALRVLGHWAAATTGSGGRMSGCSSNP